MNYSMFWFLQIKLTMFKFFDDCIILMLFNVSFLTPMPINFSLLRVRGRLVVNGHGLSMGMVVIQHHILVYKLKKTKTGFLRCTGYINSIKIPKNNIYC